MFCRLVASVTALAPADFREFLRKFVKLDKSEWSDWENVFVKCPESPWSTSHVSVDMLKQFFTGQVTQAVMDEVVFQTSLPKHTGSSVASSSLCEDDIIWETKPDKILDFFKLMCNFEAARSFLHDYAF